VVVQQQSPQARDMLVVAQDHHRQVLDALQRREGARAEALMREHSRLAQRNLRAVLSGHAAGAAPAAMPSITLIRRRT
jgi:GntR family transcriptional regulator of vanillate catabolism